jgi:hypothetical protein
MGNLVYGMKGTSVKFFLIVWALIKVIMKCSVKIRSKVSGTIKSAMEVTGHRMRNIVSDCKVDKGCNGDVTVEVSCTSNKMVEYTNVNSNICSTVSWCCYMGTDSREE